MLDSLTNYMYCEGCGQDLIFDVNKTFESYKYSVDISLDEINDEVDDLIGQYLIYYCPGCKQEYRLTYKEIEKAIRKDLTQRLILGIAKGSITLAAVMDKHLIYCGKCSGYDGRGGCPKSVLDKCEIKKFPLL